MHQPHRIDQALFTALLHTARSTVGAAGQIEFLLPGKIAAARFFYIGCRLRPRPELAVLLLAVLLRMSLACVLSVIASVGGVTVGSMSMMRRFLVMPALVVFSCLSMVPRSF